MLKILPTKTVKGICDTFTADLEAIQQDNVVAAEKLQKQIDEKQVKHNTATAEIAEAKTAISNIRALFGKTNTITEGEDK